MSVQLFAQLQGSTEYVNLSLFDAEPVKLSLSVTSIQDPLAATSVFSRTFRVPHNSINGPYFKGVFNVNSTDFDAGVKSDAYILDNGQLFTRGNIRLINVFNSNSENSIEYEILFTGETSDFGAKIGGGFLNELDFTAYNHERNLVNIQKSWDLDLFGGDLVYGLIEWGYTYDKNNRPDIPTLSNGFEKSFTNIANPLLTSQWKPQFRAKAIWDKVFENVGYTYDSDFLNSALFKKMYVITENKAEGAVSNANGAEARSTTTQYLTVGTTSQVNFGTEVLDNGNNYDPGTSTYNIPATGSYTATISMGVGSGSNSGSQNYSIAGSVSVYDINTNQTLASVGYYINTASPQTIANTLTFGASVGQKVAIRINSTCATGSGCSNGITDLRIYSGSLIYSTQSDIFSINSIMPNNVRTIDFMRSIINRFRLVFVPSKDKTNHFTITPWKDWILQGEAIDWTNKVNGDIDDKSSPIFYTQNRFNIFKDQEDSDYLNYDYQLQYKQTFGQLNLDSANELITGTKTYQDQFAAAPLAPIGFKEGDTEAPKFVIPHIAKDTGASQDAASGSPIVGKREPVQPKLRLVFYNGTRQAPLTWYSRDYSGGAQAQTIYPLMSQYSEFPVTPTTLDLCWANVAPYWDTEISVLGNGKTSNTSFTTYWKSWYDTTFDPYSRIIEVEIQLDYSDLINFKFNDYVFIENSWYFVNEVKDYIVGQNTLCKVQLIKVGNNIGITLPLVVENQLTQITLCKAATACDAYCCKDYTGATSNTYWINGIDLFESNAIYIDNAGSQYAPAGIYSDGMTAIELNGFGAVESRPDISACDCTPTTYSYTLEKVTTTPCDLYCNTNPTVVVYSTSSTFADSTYFFLDAALTIPATTGYYAEVGGFTALQVGANGQVLVTVSLADCNCVTYYPHTVCYSTLLCDSCCCYNEPITVYTNNISLSDSTLMWNDNAGATQSAIGYYKASTSSVAHVTSAGVIGEIDTCFTCDSCDAGPVQVTYGIGGSEPGYTSTVTLEKSFDNINWIEVGTLIFTSGGEVQDTVGLEEGVYVRATFTSTVSNGQLYTYYYVNGQTVFYNINDTPGSRTIYSTGTITAANLYQLSGYVSGGDPAPIEDEIIVVGNFNQYKSAGFPGAGGGLYGAIADVNNVGDINTQFNIGQGGFTYTVYGGTAYITGVDATQDNVYVCGYFDKYKGVTHPTGIAKLDYNGAIDTTFKTNIGTALGTTQFVNDIIVYQDKIYMAGAFNTFNGLTANAIVSLNLDGTLNTAFTSFFSAGTDVKRIYGYNNQLYAIIDGYLSPVRLNLNGTRDTSWNMTPVYGSPNYPGGTVKLQTVAFYNNVAYYGYQVGGTDTGGIYQCSVAKADAITGTFINWTGSNTALFKDSIDNFPKISSMVIDSTGIWVAGKFDTIYQNSTTYDRDNFAKLNSAGIYDSSFVSDMTMSGPLTSEVNKLLLDSTGIYVGGQYNTVNGNTAFPSRDLVKVNKTTGSVITSFATGYSFTPQEGAATYDMIFRPSEPILYPINVYKSTNTPCESYCNQPNTIVYSENASLASSSVLYQDANANAGVTAGWYSDGGIIAQTDNYGVIIGYTNINTCTCNTLYPFDVAYDPDLCVSCGVTGTPVLETVYGTNPNWSSNSILYFNQVGSTFAAPGWYAYNSNISLQVGTNGVVQLDGDCAIDCGASEDCVTLRVLNTSGQTLDYSYEYCGGGGITYGSMFDGEVLFTSCMVQGSFQASGSYLIQRVLYC